jgi:hypothetical protein
LATSLSCCNRKGQNAVDQTLWPGFEPGFPESLVRWFFSINSELVSGNRSQLTATSSYNIEDYFDMYMLKLLWWELSVSSSIF